MQVQDPCLDGKSPELCYWTRCWKQQPIHSSRPHFSVPLHRQPQTSSLEKNTFCLSLLGLERVKGHATSILFLPKMQNLHLTRRKRQANPQPKSSSKCRSSEIVQEMRWKILAAKQQSERPAGQAFGMLLLLKLLLWLFLSWGPCLTGADRPLWEVKPASEN